MNLFAFKNINFLGIICFSFTFHPHKYISPSRDSNKLCFRPQLIFLIKISLLAITSEGLFA